MTRRIDKDVRRGDPVSFKVDGQVVRGYRGETLATVLLSSGITAFRYDRSGAPRGPVCNMGVCYECVVWVGSGGGEPMTRKRSCMVRAAEGLVVSTTQVEVTDGG